MSNEFKIYGTVEERKGYLHFQLNAGFLDNKKRNRKSVASGLKIRGNRRNATEMLDTLIDDLTAIHESTGVMDLHQLYDIHKSGDPLERYIVFSKDIDKRAALNGDDYPFSKIIDEYLRYAKIRVDENTYNKYDYAAKRVKPYFDDAKVTIKTIKPKDVIDYYTDMMDEDWNAERGSTVLKPGTLSAHTTVMQETMRYAKDIAKIIEYNTIADVKSPKKERRAPSFYNRLEINKVFRLLRVCNDGKSHVLEPVVLLTATYGLRRQEVLGLKWSAIDFNDCSCGKYGSLTVRHTCTKVGSKTVKKDKTKTVSSLRTLPLTKHMATYLKRLYAHQKKMQAMCKTGYVDSDYVCRWEDGHEIRPDYVSSTWKDLLVKFGMTHIRFHDLRHSCASLLVKMKFSLKDIQEWLGHADIKSTEIYIHLYNSKEEVAIQIDKVLEFDAEFDFDADMDFTEDDVA